MIITADVKLPRGGNPELGIPETLIMRGATVSEWKSIISSSSKKYRYVALWKLCDQTPGYSPDIAIDELLSPIDITQMMIYSRILTLGPEIEIVVRCPNCGASNTITLDLSTIEYSEFDGVNKETITIEYPNPQNPEILDKIPVVVKTFFEADLDKLRDKAEKLLASRKRNNPKYDLDLIDILGEIMPFFRIESIDGKKVNFDYITQVYPNISIEDYMEIESVGNELDDKVIALTKTTKCFKCGKEIEYSIPRGREVLFYKHKRKSRASTKGDR